MLIGTGGLILGDLDFASDVVPLFNNTFELTQKYSHYGYSYVSSSEKMLVPSVDNFDAKSREWTISVQMCVLEDPIIKKILGDKQARQEQKYFEFTGSAESSLVIPSSFTVESVYNHTTCKNLVRVGLQVTPNRGQFQVFQTSLIFSSDSAQDVVSVVAFGSASNVDALNIINQEMSFAGIVNDIGGDNLLVHAPKVQVQTLPSLKIGSQYNLTLNVIKELEIFKIL